MKIKGIVVTGMNGCCALAGKTGGAIRVCLDFLVLLHQGKRTDST